MPAYKGQFIRESILSILNQDYKDFELIVVDDASPDNLESIVSEFQDERIRFYRNEKNIGGSDLVAQWNHSLEYARGEWVVLATDDDTYEPEFLSTADDVLTRYPQVNIFRARICPCDVEGNIISVEACMPEYTTLEEFFYMMFTHKLSGGIPQFIFRKKVLYANNLFFNIPKAYGTDGYTPLLLAKDGIASSGKILVKFRESGINISASGKFVDEKVIARFLVYEAIFNDIVPLLSDANYFVDNSLKSFPYLAKMDILGHIYFVPLLQRHKYIHWIFEHTPYLNKRNKYSMIFRAYIKK